MPMSAIRAQLRRSFRLLLSGLLLAGAVQGARRGTQADAAATRLRGSLSEPSMTARASALRSGFLKCKWSK